ncbi:phosphatase [Solidesulfovibrio sp.]|uniref:phosphatase domain-containing putative toxin n=1 Tax=Solidesulfovibrio sp. TaxID=2910990 RepID=UPI002629A402|nr:phosphatase [Solidesulfovibrio sp.]
MKPPRPAPPFSRMLVAALFALFLTGLPRALPATRHQPKSDVSGPVLIYDYPPGQGLPIHFRLADGGPKGDPAAARLRLSGSSECDAPGLDNLARFLPGPLTVVDLRQESHGFLNDRPVSWYGPKDEANMGKTPEEAARDEADRLAALAKAGTTEVTVIEAKSKDGGIKKSHVLDVDVTSVASEAQLTAARQIGYLRLFVTDDMAPDAAQVDRFVEYCRTMAPGMWIHVHCHAGDGRTTTFMVLYALLHNPTGQSLEKIAAAQAAAGGVDLVGQAKKHWKKDLYLARVDFLRRFAAYATANPGGGPQTFSQWLAAQPR